MGRTHKKTVSEGERRTTRQPFRPPCWTQYIRDKDEEVGILSHGLRSIPRKVLCQRDIQSRYTIVHAICSSKLEIAAIRRQFGELNDLNLMGKVVAKDGDGDMPLQSAVRSGASVETVDLILNYVPGSKKIMLQNKNRSSETALELSLFLDKTDVFELLLEECIKMKLLSELTGIGKATRHSSTLVHKCIRHRRIAFLRAYLEVCQSCDVKPALCVANEKGYTPWLYLLRYDTKDHPLVEEVFDVLQQHNICLSSLYVDERNRETILHKAYRNGNQMLIDLVTKSDPTALEKLDRHKRKPQQRNRKLVEEELLTSRPHGRNAVKNTRQSQREKRERRPQPVNSATPIANTAPPPPPSAAAPSAAPTQVKRLKQQSQRERRAPASTGNVPAHNVTSVALKATKEEREVGQATFTGVAGLKGQAQPQKPVHVSAAIDTHHTGSSTLKEASSHHISRPKDATTRRDSDELMLVQSEGWFAENSVSEKHPHSPDPHWVPGRVKLPKQLDPEPSEHCTHSDADDLMTIPNHSAYIILCNAPHANSNSIFSNASTRATLST